MYRFPGILELEAAHSAQEAYDPLSCFHSQSVPTCLLNLSYEVLVCCFELRRRLAVDGRVIREKQ